MEEENKKRLKKLYTLLTVTILVYVTTLSLLVNYLEEGTLLGIIICVLTIIMLIVAFYSLKLEMEIGYYECRKCNHRYEEKNYLKITFAPHFGTTRYLKCPKCNKRSWQKKVMTK